MPQREGKGVTAEKLTDHRRVGTAQRCKRESVENGIMDGEAWCASPPKKIHHVMSYHVMSKAVNKSQKPTKEKKCGSSMGIIMSLELILCQGMMAMVTWLVALGPYIDERAVLTME